MILHTCGLGWRFSTLSPAPAPTPRGSSRHNGGVFDSLQALLDDVATGPGPWPRIIGIDGPSGSGKTTLADDVRACLAGSRSDTRRTTPVGLAGPRSAPAPTGRVQVVHMDDIYPGWDGLHEAVELVTRWVLEPLSHGEAGRFRRWDWAANTRAEEVVVTPQGWVIVEGVGSGSGPCREFLSALVWVEAGAEVRMARGIERDGESYRPHWQRWARQESELFAREETRQHADLVIQT